MKYYQTSKFPSKVIKAGATFVAVFCLILIGAAAWFATSKIETIPQSDSSQSSDNSSEYTQENASYNSSVTTENSEDASLSSKTEANEAQDVGQTVSDQPYQENETENTTESKAEEEITFVMPISGNIAKGYSDTALQYSATFGDLRLHTGIDILCDEGSEICAAAKGSVISVEEDSNLGQTVAIDHGNGITARYSCLASVNVKAGDTVSAGDSLGTSGTVPSEESDLPHIHIEVLKDGNLASPLEVFGLE